MASGGDAAQSSSCRNHVDRMAMKGARTMDDYQDTKSTDPRNPSPWEDEEGQLSDEQLDEVAGGLNPQPIPPGRQ
jgi:hypothetical protein